MENIIEMLNGLPVRARALRETQSLWNKERFSQQEAQRKRGVRVPIAYELRDELLHDFRFAYRADESLLGRVSKITEGGIHTDMIQDLNDFVILCRANLALLKAVSNALIAFFWVLGRPVSKWGTLLLCTPSCCTFFAPVIIFLIL